MRVALAPYDAAWPRRYEAERARITAALGKSALRVEHIGSTAVPGFAAKPVVDVQVLVHDVDDAAVDTALRNAGYELHVVEPRHRMYRTKSLDTHVHLWMDEAEAERHVTFRDWIRAHPDDRDLYLHVKRQLAAREWATQNDYAQAKTAVVSTILRRAQGRDEGPRIDAFARIISGFVPRGARVLEIGAGEGLLAARLASQGFTVVALDTQLRSRYPIVESSFEAYEAPARSFDCVAAQLVLHHADSLEATLDKARSLLRPRGIIAIDDYGWERSPNEAFRSERADLHRSEEMLHALRARFSQAYYAEHAYIQDGEGTANLSFTFIGRLD